MYRKNATEEKTLRYRRPEPVIFLALLLAVTLFLAGCGTGGQERRLAFLGKPLRAEIEIVRGEKSGGGILELGGSGEGGGRFMRLTFTSPKSLEGIVAEKRGDTLTLRLGGKDFSSPEASEALLRAGELFSDTGVLLSAKRVRNGDENLTELTMSSSAGDRTLTLNDSDRLLSITAEDIKVTVVWLEKLQG